MVIVSITGCFIVYLEEDTNVCVCVCVCDSQSYSGCSSSSRAEQCSSAARGTQ